MKSYTVLPKRESAPVPKPDTSAVEQALLQIPQAIRDAAPEVVVNLPTRPTDFKFVFHRHPNGPYRAMVDYVTVEALR